MNLVNRLNPNLSNIKENINIDPFHYIDEEKKHIKFINSDFKLFNIKIPISITKRDLYSLAFHFKSLFNSEILLIHNNCIIDKDESSIDFISDNDIIIIIADRIYPDDTSYNSFIQQNDISNMIQIRINNRTLMFPLNLKLLEMKELIFLIWI